MTEARDGETDSAANKAATEPRRASRRMLLGVELVPAVLVLLTLVSGGLTMSLYLKQYRPTQIGRAHV